MAPPWSPASRETTTSSVAATVMPMGSAVRTIRHSSAVLRASRHLLVEEPASRTGERKDSGASITRVTATAAASAANSPAAREKFAVNSISSTGSMSPDSVTNGGPPDGVRTGVLTATPSGFDRRVDKRGRLGLRQHGDFTCTTPP